MKYTPVSVACFTTVFFLLLPASARAEVVFAESIEWVLATSDRVIVGKVIKVDEITGRDNKEYQAVTVVISKSLKGAQGERETIFLPTYIEKEFAKQWMDEGISILFCLIEKDGKRAPTSTAKQTWVLRDNGNAVDAVLLGKSQNYWTGCIPVLTRDFKVLTEPDAILRHVENALKVTKPRAALQSHSVRVPGKTAVSKKLWSGSAVYLTVPVDQELEALGQQWCKSDSPWKRAEGAKILSHYNTSKNIAILKSLLADCAAAESTRYRTVPGKTDLELVSRKKMYYVRQSAFAALRVLGAKVKAPVLEELLEGHDE
jgi:hypothetical protein